MVIRAGVRGSFPGTIRWERAPVNPSQGEQIDR
jgi:hypothetical protein